MKCKDIERLIIESSERDLSEEELTQIKQHVSGCIQCARFQDDLEEIRIHLKKMKEPFPSVELVKQTQLMCQAQMRAPRQIRSTPIPAFIWTAFIFLIVLTVILILPLSKDLILDQTLSLPTVVVLALMIQNAVMLCFSPLLLRKYRSKNQGLKSA